MKINKKLFFSLIWSFYFLNFTFANSDLEINSANFLASKWIIVDKSLFPSEYKLNDFVLRQEIAAVTLGIKNISKNTNCKNIFKDVAFWKPNNWACYTIEALVENNLIAKNNFFRPEDKITKSEAIGMIVKSTYDNEYKFDFSKWWNWQKQVVDFAVSKWIVWDFSDYNNFATRWFVFSVAEKALKNKEKNISKNEIKNNSSEEIIKNENKVFIENKTTSPKIEEPKKVNVKIVENKIIENKTETPKIIKNKKEEKIKEKYLTLDEIEKKVKKVITVLDWEYYDAFASGNERKNSYEIKENENLSDYILYKYKGYNFLSKIENFKSEEIEKKVKKVVDLSVSWENLYEAFTDKNKKILKINGINNSENLWEYILFKNSTENDSYYFWWDFISKIENFKNIDEIRKEMLEKINEYRISKWKNPLKINEKLNKAAQEHAEDLFKNKINWHTWSDGSDAKTRILRNSYKGGFIWENVFKTPRNVDEAMKWWKESTWHNKNMLSNDYEEIWFWYFWNNWVQVFWTEMK